MIDSKLPKVSTTIFTVMSKLAADVGALNLSQGFPEFDCDVQLRELVCKYLNAGLNQYAPMAGIMKLREAISVKTQALYRGHYDPELEVTVTPGATYAMFTAITAFIKPLDEVIVLEPCYDSYVPGIEVNGGVPVFIRMREPDFRVDWDEVERAITPRTRMIIVNSPHNPTGTLLTKSDLNTLARILSKTNIIVASDEVYEHLVFDGEKHVSVASIPELRSRSLVISSFGKTYHVTGWKMGYVVAPQELMHEFRKVHQYNAFCANSPIQYALADYMQDEDAYLSLSTFYEQKRDLFVEALAGSRFKPLQSKGSFFQNLSYEGISDEDDKSFAIRLTKDYKVASVPFSAFYHTPIADRVLRFCFAKTDETLMRAAEQLRKI